MKYKITYFDNKAQAVKEKFFRTYELAYKWAKKNLENYDKDGIIQPIY